MATPILQCHLHEAGQAQPTRLVYVWVMVPGFYLS